MLKNYLLTIILLVSLPSYSSENFSTPCEETGKEVELKTSPNSPSKTKGWPSISVEEARQAVMHAKNRCKAKKERRKEKVQKILNMQSTELEDYLKKERLYTIEVVILLNKTRDKADKKKFFKLIHKYAETKPLLYDSEMGKRLGEWIKKDSEGKYHVTYDKPITCCVGAVAQLLSSEGEVKGVSGGADGDQ